MESPLIGILIVLLVGGAAGWLWWLRWRSRLPS